MKRVEEKGSTIGYESDTIALRTLVRMSVSSSSFVLSLLIKMPCMDFCGGDEDSKAFPRERVVYMSRDRDGIGCKVKGARDENCGGRG